MLACFWRTTRQSSDEVTRTSAREKGQAISYEAVVEDTGDSVRNGIAAQCGNRDFEPKILCGNSSFYDSCADGILAGYAAASGPVSAGIFYKAQSIFGGCVLGDRLCCGNYQ